MLAAVDLDGQAARETRQLAGAGVRHHGDRHVHGPGSHRAAVLEDEAAAAPLQGPADLLDRHASSRALGGAAGVEHLPLGGGLEVAVVLLVEGHPAEARVGLEFRRQGGHLHVERSACMLRHGRLLSNRAGRPRPANLAPSVAAGLKKRDIPSLTLREGSGTLAAMTAMTGRPGHVAAILLTLTLRSAQWETRGVLRPGTQPPGSPMRFPPADDLSAFVDLFWIARWDLEPGETMVVETLPHPCVNVVVERGRSLVHGPVKGRFSRTLAGRWRVVAARLLPSAFRHINARTAAHPNDAALGFSEAS